VHVVVAANRWSEIRPSMRDLLAPSWELRLGDPMESNSGAGGRGVPHQVGRGLTANQTPFPVGLPRLDSSSATEDVTTATKAAVEEIATFWTGPAAPEVRMLPTRLSAENCRGRGVTWTVVLP